MSGEVTGPRNLSLTVVFIKGTWCIPRLNIYVYSHITLLLLQPWSEKLLYSEQESMERFVTGQRTEQKQLLSVQPCKRLQYDSLQGSGTTVEDSAAGR